MKKETWYVIVGGLFLASVVVGVLNLAMAVQDKQARAFKASSKSPLKYSKMLSSGNKIAVVEVSGAIYHEESRGRWLRKDPIDEIIAKVKEYGKDSSVKGILLRVNSPGGSVGAVQEIYNQLLKTKAESKKPVVCFVPEICASGGYYLACTADKVVCTPGAIIGSIGVILQVGNVGELFKKIGVKMVVIKSSKYKDIGSMYREMTPEEQKILEDLVNTAYGQFVSAVAEGRKLTTEEVLKFADGRIVIAERAKEHRMIDELGDEDAAIAALKELAGIKGEAEILRDEDPMEYFRELFSSFGSKKPVVEQFLGRKFRFEYMFE